MEECMPEHSEHQVVRIDLTPSQKEQLKAATGRDAEALEIAVQELEERIAPLTLAQLNPPTQALAANHNETFLRE